MARTAITAQAQIRLLTTIRAFADRRGRAALAAS